MQIVKIKTNSPTMDGKLMPKWLYNNPLRVLEDNDDFIMVLYVHDDNMESYEFEKEYIERSI